MDKEEWVSGLNHTVANGINSHFLIVPKHTFEFLLVKLINKHRTNQLFYKKSLIEFKREILKYSSYSRMKITLEKIIRSAILFLE